MEAGRTGPEHTVSREQVWTVTAGALEVTCEGRTEKVSAGQTFVVPPNALRPPKARTDFTVPALFMPSSGGSVRTGRLLERCRALAFGDGAVFLL